MMMPLESSLFWHFVSMFPVNEPGSSWRMDEALLLFTETAKTVLRSQKVTAFLDKALRYDSK